MASLGSVSSIPDGYDPVEYDLSNYITLPQRKEIASKVKSLGHYFVELFDKRTNHGSVPSMRVWKITKDDLPFTPRMIGKTDKDFNIPVNIPVNIRLSTFCGSGAKPIVYKD